MSKFSFADLKKQSKNSVSSLQERLKSTERKGFQKDERFWEPTKDDNGNALAVIRFLPAPAGEELSYVTYYSHRFSLNNRWYVERSLTTIGKDDPLGEANKILWDTGDEAKREIVRKRKRGLNYVANILVIKDTNAPENNGKVFLYRFGAKIFEKIKNLAQPELEEDTPIDVFNIFEGANFRLKVKKQGEFPNYDDSKFENPSPLAGGKEAEMEKIWNQCYSLEAEVAENKFKTYEELKKKLDWVLSGSESSGKTADQKLQDKINESSKDDDDDLNVLDDKVSKPKQEKKKDDDDDDDGIDLSSFKLDDDDDDQIPF